jgi:hypothetical protein
MSDDHGAQKVTHWMHRASPLEAAAPGGTDIPAGVAVFL